MRRITRCMPLDVVKTHMQSLEACALYRNSFHCADLIFTEESILSFWTGTTPRLAQLLVVTSEDIYVDGIYEKNIVDSSLFSLGRATKSVDGIILC